MTTKEVREGKSSNLPPTKSNLQPIANDFEDSTLPSPWGRVEEEKFSCDFMFL